MAVRVPSGVCLGIAPWNAPIILGVRAIAMALACGNTVILKASELCPATHWLIGSVLRDAGLPPGVVNIVTNAPENAGAVVGALIAHNAVKRINFTGSTRVGRIIAHAAAEQLKPVLLELGGKAPLVVLDDADLDEAVNAAAFGAYMNQGQICMSTERIVVVEQIADEFVARLAAKTARLPCGNPRRNDVVLGSPIMAATLIDMVTPAMKLYAEESFGPVAVVVRARDTDDAVRIANDSDYGLSAAVFGKDVSRAMSVAARIQSGICHVNGPTVHDEAQMPFGGVKDSGYGRFGGKAAIAEFTDLRWMTVQSGHRHYPF